jgi:calreticulin
MLLLASLCSIAVGKIYFQERFSDDWLSRWVIPKWKKSEAGKWKIAASPFGEDKGLTTTEDAKFYAAAAKFPEFTNEKELVVQFQVAFPQDIDCGGGYIKLFGPELDPVDYSGDSKYNIMFGPDICGSSTKKVHVIFRNPEDDKNLDHKKTVPAEHDKLSHIYTLVVNSDNTYKVFIDDKEKESGSLKTDWPFLKAKEIDDPKVSKPSDWVEDAMIDDPEDKKPEGYDSIPKTIADPDAEKPEDWDDEDDGVWEAPQIENPKYKGPWKAKRISNPNYKGPWVHPQIANPEFKDNDKLYQYTFGGIGIDIWQVKSGTVFDNIIICDSLAEARAFAKQTFPESAREAEKKAESKQQDDAAEKARKEREEREAADKDSKDEEEDDDEDDEPEHSEL